MSHLANRPCPALEMRLSPTCSYTSWLTISRLREQHSCVFEVGKTNQLFKNYVSPAQRSARKDLQGRGSWGMAACLRGFWVTSSPWGLKVSFSPTDFEINFDQKNLQKQAGLAGWLVNQSPWGSDINGTFTCKYSKSQARWSMILWPPKQNDDPNRTNLPDPERPPCSLWLLRVWPVRHHNFGKIPPEPSFEKEKIKSHIGPHGAIENQDFRKSQSKMLFLVR